MRLHSHPPIARAVVVFALVAGTAAQLGAQDAPAAPDTLTPPTDSTTAAPVGAGLAGAIVDERGAPISYAQLFLVDGSLGTVADEWGRFLIQGLPAEQIDFGVRRIGFEPLSFRIQLLDERIVHVRVRLKQVVRQLATVSVEDARTAGLLLYGFYDRMDIGTGTFFLPEQIETRRASRVSDIVRDAPGVYVDGRANRSRGSDVVGLQAAEAAGIYGTLNGRVCPMSLFIDGIYTPGRVDELVPPENILAIELYQRAASIPQRFQRTESCGAIVVWTKFVRWIEPQR
jgi:hypothetical protein